LVEQLAVELAGRMRVAKLNVDENPATAARFRIQSIPALLIFKGGREVERIIGAQPKSEILRRLQRIVG
jgi:thioredoxin-like negative regulator of GroEL